ncbi:MAG: hypothetical protein UX91_C0006G0037 [Candidatus Amesbacteria bacterium GW2011_GWB1_47_19]|nr:MAG: hypothetical protein UW51_C0002G0037 [Candidatus Amesbacteria bacterium GW2011_GWA1_44_24]KKU31372.1 MAG: hypothetical protein UX46_C0006G0164 [Candidatus Amesbacteria bacterium GW2011_GWC1_46_24]KKU66975.1 MAG: hypothetical protein UX91_C0006G0037 [Candidatus Amesbacteria bacterium GW2011_GWB1_47_19]OGD05691.1 MAG: hypothetical protein A2379_05600 [Candidatus Amesbacteria bacterium RIFOXYB1_FULL_47_13]HBC72807.1 hypothetical protein [Candidatus Amesbacteria bacterium]
MQALAILAASLIFVFGIVFRPPRIPPRVTPELSPTPFPVPSRTPVPVARTTPVLPIAPPPETIWFYPGSVLVSPDTYETPDDPDKVTLWYKEKINAIGLNVRSYVQTKTNDSVLNKLVGAGADNIKISVEISKAAGTVTTRIRVTIDNQ